MLVCLLVEYTLDVPKFYIRTAHSAFSPCDFLTLLGRYMYFRPVAKTFSTITAFRGGVVNPTPKPGRPWYSLLSESSPLTCTTWEILLLAWLSGYNDHAGLTKLKTESSIVFCET